MAKAKGEATELTRRCTLAAQILRGAAAQTGDIEYFAGVIALLMAREKAKREDDKPKRKQRATVMQNGKRARGGATTDNITWDNPDIKYGDVI